MYRCMSELLDARKTAYLSFQSTIHIQTRFQTSNVTQQSPDRA